MYWTRVYHGALLWCNFTLWKHHGQPKPYFEELKGTNYSGLYCDITTIGNTHFINRSKIHLSIILGPRINSPHCTNYSWWQDDADTLFITYSLAIKQSNARLPYFILLETIQLLGCRAIAEDLSRLSQFAVNLDL